MSAFRDLLKQAHEKGVRQMCFTVDLSDFFADEQSKSWVAEDAHKASRRLCLGRTGEEALRRFVEGLK